MNQKSVFFLSSLVLFGAMSLFPAPSIGAAGNPPDGKYEVNKISGSSYIHIGTLEIKGNTYRGLVAEGPFYPYTMDGAGSMIFTKGLVGMPDGWKLKPGKFVGKDSYGKPFIQIFYNSARGAAEVADAVKEK